MDYEKDVEIDESALDVEWLNQAKLAVQYGREWAYRVQLRMRAEEHLKVVTATLVKKVNDDPETYLGSGVKSTIANVEAYYIKQKTYIEAKEALNEALYEENIAEVIKKEISTTRKAALENLVKLHALNYFAGPNMPRDLSYEAQQKAAQKKTDTGIATRLKRSR